MVMVRFNISLVSGYTHVFILHSIVNVTLPILRRAGHG